MAGVNKDGVKLVGMLVAAFAIGDYSRCFQMVLVLLYYERHRR